VPLLEDEAVKSCGTLILRPALLVLFSFGRGKMDVG